jgi:hypothetical protein
LEIQNQGKVIIGVIIAALLISFRLPVDGMSYNTALVPLFAYASMFRITENILIALTVSSFLIASYNTGTSGYRFIALGAFMVSIGRNLLIQADTWLGAPLGILLLAGGTWIFITRLRRIYMWS